jgi:hypothetical protein
MLLSKRGKENMKTLATVSTKDYGDLYVAKLRNFETAECIGNVVGFDKNEALRKARAEAKKRGLKLVSKSYAG